MPIGMICPNCLEYGHHPTTATEPKWYIYNDSATKLFKSELGRDICYRIRHKTCTECGFITEFCGWMESAMRKHRGLGEVGFDQIKSFATCK